MPTTVLYIHGLESGPQGNKPRNLAAAGLTVVSKQMPCNRADIRRDPVLIVGGAGAMGLIAVATLRKGWAGAGVAGIALALGAPWARAWMMRRVFSRSLSIQQRALQEHAVDVVMGSSFGGAVALELLLRGDWTGPTVLLCPAYVLAARRARWHEAKSLASLPESVASRVLVVHGRADEIVPFGHSEALVAGSRGRLEAVDDDHRLTRTATPAQLGQWVETVRS